MNGSVQDKEHASGIHSDQELPQAYQPISEYSTNVSIEPNHENEIYEVQFDENLREVTEIYKEPPSYSDKLAELIGKIDFGELIQDKPVEQSASATTTNAQSETKDAMTARKLFQNIFERVKLSLDEICVMLDLLTIVRANKLMTAEEGREHLEDELKGGDGPEKSQKENFEKKVSVLLKKKNIEKAKTLLKKSLEKISNDQEYGNIKFHLELYRARQLWKIRKIGTKFNCDLSYRSVGCINAIKLNIELLKNDVPLNPQETNPAKALYLSAIIPEEFKDYAYIHVRIIKTTKKGKKDPLFDSKFSLFTYNNSSNPLGCQELLEKEQNSLYCREIYENLLKEIFDPNNQTQLKPIIIGNSIQIMITMDYDLEINLVHSNEKIQKTQSQNCPKNYNYDNAILEYYLHCLLKKSFDQNFFHNDQRPITSTFAFNSSVKIAGMAYANLNLQDEEDSVISVPQNISHLLNKNKKINLLQSIKDKAEHLILRKRVLKILNSISKKAGATHLSIDQSSWNSATSSNITVTISSYYYNMLAKSFFYILIKKSNISVLNRSDNISISFTDALIDLKEYFIDQCCFHQINLILTICQQYGWTVLGNSFTNEPNKRRMSGVALVYNNNYSKKIAIKVEKTNKIQVYVNQYNTSDGSKIDPELKNLFGDLSVDWLLVKDNYTQIDLDYYPDFTEIQKFELFLAHYSTPYLVEQV
ncbi:unnamed protein product [Brachionus calyciflorus]|uniref:Mediator of RNA polymerase II transcription subunit 17 n=1 Tax=Brachionus calyciflorus TaxID=104777 RepID=A0A814FC45_9BILA|nr:unnamed protein product [Brachionus calyciflorus]